MASCASTVDTCNSLHVFVSRLLTSFSMFENMSKPTTWTHIGDTVRNLVAKLRVADGDDADVRPPRAVADTPNGVGTYAETDGKIDVAPGQSKYLARFALCELCVSAHGATRMASLLNLVGHVVVVCAKKQMIRIHTCRNIALMEHLLRVRDIAAKKHPSPPMGLVVSALDSFPTIAFACGCPEPKPATAIRFRNGPIHEYL